MNNHQEHYQLLKNCFENNFPHSWIFYGPSGVGKYKFTIEFIRSICHSKNLNQNVFDCVISVPAYFDEKARSGIMRAAFMAGLRVRRLINEPTAAAFAYGLEKKKKGIFFVYDLGGGPFDVSLLKLSDGIFKVIATSGDPNLGGDDFDILYAKWLVKKYFKIDFDSLNKKEKLKLVKKSKFLKEKTRALAAIKKESDNPPTKVINMLYNHDRRNLKYLNNLLCNR